MSERDSLILASGSAARRAMLLAAGLSFEAKPADVDEEAITSAMASESDHAEAADIARVLAREKARSISLVRPDAVVIGSDQVLAAGRRKFAKAKSLGEARQTLEALRGRSHELVSGVALAQNGEILWEAIDSAELKMRNLSDAFLDEYLQRVGNRILGSVGCYEIEGPGVQLFETIEGDIFTILGMPLLPLLGELRVRGVVPA